MIRSNAVLVDTGPLVAVLSPDDHNHQLCCEQLKELRAPLFTCWPVITEAVYLMRSRPQAVETLLRHLEPDGLLTIADLDDSAPAWIGAFFQRFHQLEPQLADAALAYIAERNTLDTIFTLDRRDFSIYRIGPRTDKALRILPESH